MGARVRAARRVCGFALAVVLMSSTIALTAVSATAATKPTAGGAITYLLSGEPTTFDPKAADPLGNTSGVTAYSVYDNLIRLDVKTGKVIPRLAESMTASSDKLTWTIKLRSGLKFTDGTPLDANAVKANWDRLANPATAATVRTTIADWAWTVQDARTIKVTLPLPLGGFPFYMARSAMTYIASPAALAKFGSSYGSSAQTTVGAGPFVLSEWLRGDHITETRNPGFWDAPRPYLDTLTFKPVSDLNQKATTLLAGQADVAFMPTVGAETIRLTEAGLKSYGAPSDYTITVRFNTSKAPVDDIRVRQALSLAIDQKDVNLKGYNGAAPVAKTWFPESSLNYDPSVKVAPTNFAKAQKLIDAYVAEKGGPVRFPFNFASSLSPIASAVAQGWARLKNVSFTSDSQLPAASTANFFSGDFVVGLTATPQPGNADSLYLVLHSGLATNPTKVSIPELDKALDASRIASSPADLRTALSKVTKIALDNVLFAPLFYNYNLTFVQKKLRDVTLAGLSSIDTANIWLAK